ESVTTPVISPNVWPEQGRTVRPTDKAAARQLRSVVRMEAYLLSPIRSHLSYTKPILPEAAHKGSGFGPTTYSGEEVVGRYSRRSSFVVNTLLAERWLDIMFFGEPIRFSPNPDDQFC